jgi:FlaA1/EpsC-like NDP-sugar epimerase
MGTGGDVFLLDMGESVKIVDLAQQMIRLSGFRPIDENGVGDIDIQFTGLRPGEKLNEELLIDAENVEQTGHERILKSYEWNYDFLSIGTTFKRLNKIQNEQDYDDLLVELSKHVEGYRINFFRNNSA